MYRFQHLLHDTAQQKVAHCSKPTAVTPVSLVLSKIWHIGPQSSVRDFKRQKSDDRYSTSSSFLRLETWLGWAIFIAAFCFVARLGKTKDPFEQPGTCPNMHPQAVVCNLYRDVNFVFPNK
ncbi:expressed unknown protein [Seminavis robusta]|uniref:Uncharacterized protein n=1 Tax=Seminavis robusta TaxID=568900 RepID=A0A9N8E7X3_9STRA|nr:expressed unknown protein [Seminavis robusta]|eukprot:Sro718_g192181.1  (121) ;mRNA; r:25725-26233